MRYIIPNMSWLLKLRSEAYDFMNVYERHLVDFEGFFHKKTNPFSSIPITLHFKEINDDLENFELPESWEEAEKICGFLNDFPEFYTQIKRVVIPASVIWSVDDDYIEGPYGESLDSWKFEGGGISVGFFIVRLCQTRGSTAAGKPEKYSEMCFHRQFEAP